jgi:threonine/homoserine/homoserine lactone efflux protein
MDYFSNSLLAFLGISALVIVTPGPDTAVTIRNTLLGGRAGGLATALGVAAGQAIWALATSAGIVALLVASEPLFLAVKYAGAAYLVVLGLQSLRSTFRPAVRRDVPTADASWAAPQLPPRIAFRQGVISDLGNPKMAAFFTSLLPQFAPSGEASFTGIAILGLAFSLMTLLWLAGYALAIARIGTLLNRPAIRRALDGLTGLVLVSLGLKLAADRG